MAKIKVKGKAGAAKNFITRNQALKKLQCSLSDFRRLCILKGIFPREPRNKKKANAGNSAPASFYYSKDIQYLLHEPVLHILREHKTFSKKISKALAKGENETAGRLEVARPVYRLDHIIKQRYPTFNDSLKDLSDVICLLALFAHLPSNQKISPDIIQNCTQLYSAWQLYIMKTQSLRKVFLSIKGVYFEAVVNGVIIRWLVPHSFTQHVPADIDFRIMLTFLDLYQTLMRFVLYKLYTDINLVYPPPVDVLKAQTGAGINSFSLTETPAIPAESSELPQKTKVTAKAVKKTIKALAADMPITEDAPVPSTNKVVDEAAEDIAMTVFDGDEALPTLATLENETQADLAAASVLRPCIFFLSREVPRSTLEFTIRSFGGVVGWEPSAGAGSPYESDDPRITHYIIDRPTVPSPVKGRVFVQPQWVVDTVNAKQILPTQAYSPGELLPPHLSPFVDNRAVAEAGGYVPADALDMESSASQAPVDAESNSDEDEDDEDIEGDMNEPDIEEDSDDSDDEVEEIPKKVKVPAKSTPALKAAAADPSASNIHAAELEAEAMGLDATSFKKNLAAESKKPENKNARKRKATEDQDDESKLDKIMMTNKNRKLYDKMVYGKGKKAEEKNKLTARKEQLIKKAKKSKL